MAQNDWIKRALLVVLIGIGLPVVLGYLGVQEQRPIHACERLVRGNDCGHFDCGVEL